MKKSLFIIILMSLWAHFIFSQQYDHIINEAVKFESLTEIYDSSRFVAISEGSGRNEDMICLDKSGNVIWSKQLKMHNEECNSFSANLPIKSNRISYNQPNNNILIVGQFKDYTVKTTGVAAYILLNASNGTILKQKYLNILPGCNFIGTTGSEKYGFFAAGEESSFGYSNPRPIIGRIDPADSTNNWMKNRDTLGVYNDVAVDDSTQALIAVGYLQRNDANHILVDFWGPSSGNLVLSSVYGYKPESTYQDIQADVIESIGNGRFLIAGHHSGGSFIMMYHFESSNGLPYWVTSVEVDEILELSQISNGEIAFVYKKGTGFNNHGIGLINLNGDLEWSQRYNRDEIPDLVGNIDGGITFLAYDSTSNKTSLVTADQYGKTGCDTGYYIITDSMDLEALETNFTTPLTINELNQTDNFLNTSTVTTSQGSCCWFPYDPFPGRTTYFCNPAILDADPSGNGYSSIIWTGSKSTPVPDGSTGTVGFTNNSVNIITVTVSNEEGCKGFDKVPILVAGEADFINATDTLIYCKNTSGPIYLPVVKDYNSNFDVTSLWRNNDDQSVITDNDLTNWDPLTAVNSGVVVQYIDENVFNPNCIVKLNQPYEVIDCSCEGEDFSVNFWIDQWGKPQYGIIPVSNGLQLPIVKYRFSIIREGCMSPDTSPAYNLQELTLLNQPSGTINGFLYPMMSGKKLIGWTGTPYAIGTDHDLLLEIWYTDDTYYPYKICGYKSYCMEDIDLQARKGKEKRGKNDFTTQIDEPDALINVYPNPSKGQFNFENLSPNALITVYDLQNKVILESRADKNGNKKIDLKNLQDGLYLYRVYNNNQFTNGKIVKH